MALNDITSEAVIAAIAEFDQLGREEFLSQYGFGPARRYLLVYRGAEYDSKAIVGAAHGYLPGRRKQCQSQFSRVGDTEIAPTMRTPVPDRMGRRTARWRPTQTGRLPATPIGQVIRKAVHGKRRARLPPH